MDKIFKFHKKKITLEEIRNLYNLKADEYMELYRLVNELIEENKIEVIKASKPNGRKAELYNGYMKR